MTDISKVKVGDWLVRGRWMADDEPAGVGHKVIKITAKRAATAEGQYDLASGKGFGSGTFWRASIATAEEVAEIEAKVNHKLRYQRAWYSTYRAHRAIQSVYEKDVPTYVLDACEALEVARLKWINERNAK